MIFLDTNVMSEPMRKSPSPAVLAWLAANDIEIALSSVAVGEMAFGMIPSDQRAKRFERHLSGWRRRYADRLFAFTEEAAMVYGDVMGSASLAGTAMSTADGMIAAIAMINGGRLATRNLAHFESTGLDLVSPWSA